MKCETCEGRGFTQSLIGQETIASPCNTCNGRGIINVSAKYRTVIYVESKEDDIFHEIVIGEESGYILLSSDMARIPIRLNPEECQMIASSLRFHARNVLGDEEEISFEEEDAI